MCTFVDHPTRGKLHFAYTKDYKGTLKSQQSSKAVPLSPSSDSAPRRSSNACADDFKYLTSPQSTVQGRNDISLPTVYDASPKNNCQGQTRGKLSDGPELIHSVRTRSFSFSSIITMSYTAPEPRDGESSSFRKEPEEIVDEPKVVVTSSVRPKLTRAPWDGLVSIFYSQKKDEHKKQNLSRKEEEPVALDEPTKDEFKKEEHRKDDNVKEEQRRDEQKIRSLDSFLPYLSFVQEPYNEESYRALMKPPLGGLAMIISTELNSMDSF